MKAIGYRGILDIGYRFDRRDGLYKVLDVNPRIGSTFRLFVASNGLDVARSLYLDFTGQPVPASDVPAGRKWMVEDLDLIASFCYSRDGKLGAAEWLRSFRGVRETAFFASDDPGPVLAMLLNDAGEFARRVRMKLSSSESAPNRDRAWWMKGRHAKG